MRIATGKDASWQKWQDNNKKDYGAVIIRYAEAWANLMEAKLESEWDGVLEGRVFSDDRFAEIAKATSYEANTEGITGFMYGAAVQVLADCWIFGEQLRRWHNLATQIHNEGEAANEKPGAVLNPALLSIGVGKSDEAA